LPQLSQADDLLWAKRRVAQLETAATVVEEKAAVAENPGLSKSWRRTGERGGNRQLNKEHQITAEVFAGGYVKPLDGPSPRGMAGFRRTAMNCSSGSASGGCKYGGTHKMFPKGTFSKPASRRRRGP
jgi:hypothetical protein